MYIVDEETKKEIRNSAIDDAITYALSEYLAGNIKSKADFERMAKELKED